jgi:diguanylate cyclase (GGDEF)-like protein
MLNSIKLPARRGPRALLGLVALACAAAVATAVSGHAAHPQLQHLATAAVLGAVSAIAWRVVTVGTDRLAWGLLGVAGACWGGADVVYAVFFAGLDSPPAPSVADVLWLAYYPFAIAGVALLVRGRLGRVPDSYWLDAALGVAAAGAVAATVSADLIAETSGPTRLASLVAVGYPVGDFLTLLLIVGAMIVCRAWSSASWMLLAASLGLGVAADTAYLVGVGPGTSAAGDLLALGLPLGALLLALGAWQPEAAKPAAEAGPDRWSALAICGFFGLVAIVLLVIDHFQRLPVAAVALASVSLLVLIARLVAVFRENFDILDLKHEEAMTDTLTGLGNRRAVLADLERGAETDAVPAALCLFDLNGFKGYNDLFGHPAGDLLLARLAGRLAEAASSVGGVAYRLGGDEFCVIVPLAGGSTEEIAIRAAAALRERGDGFGVSAAWGAAELPCAGGAEEALRRADQQMYAQKNGSRPTAARQTVDVLLAAVRERAPDLGDHVNGVAELAVSIAGRFDLARHEVECVRLAAELHDIGKIAVPDAILLKAGPLDHEEWSFMHRHTIIGERILLAAPDLRDVSPLVRSSHEHWDGSGYPDGLRGERIPLGARIVSVCDAFDAMLTRRPYSNPMSTKDSLAEISRCSGTQFDPGVVAAFNAVMDERRMLLASVS